MEPKSYKPKQYSHIDYEALIIYLMKHRISVEQAIKDLDLNISRITVTRNLNKMEQNPIVAIYREEYIPNVQKGAKMPEEIVQEIQNLPDKEVQTGDILEETYRTLSIMKEIIEQCGGNMTQAAKVISGGATPLGNVSITHQGLSKNMKNYERVKEEYKKQKEARQNSQGERSKK